MDDAVFGAAAGHAVGEPLALLRRLEIVDRIMRMLFGVFGGIDKQAIGRRSAVADEELEHIFRSFALQKKDALARLLHTFDDGAAAAPLRHARLEPVSSRYAVDDVARVLSLSQHVMDELRRSTILHPAVRIGDFRAEIDVRDRALRRNRRRIRRISRSSSALITARSALRLATPAGSMNTVSPVLLVRWMTPCSLWR